MFSCEQGKYEENDKSAQKSAIWKFLRIPKILKVNRDFWMSKITPVIFSKWISKLYEDFEKRFRILTNIVSEPPQTEAQPPLAVAKIKLHSPFLFSLISLLNYFVYNYFLLFIYLSLFN